MDSETHSKPSCASGLSRKEFIKKIIERGATAGALAVSADAYNAFRSAPNLLAKGASGGT